MNDSVAGIILAAGKGTRMQSDLPKGLFEVCGVPMVELIGRAMRKVGVERPAVVVGYEGQQIVDRLGDGYEYVWQHEQHGTGHAARMAEDLFRSFDGPVLVVPGDVPLLTADALRNVLEQHVRSRAQATIGTCRLENPQGYGRIVRDPHGRAMAIVEEKDANPRQRGITEVNTGVYCFDAKALFGILPRLGSENAQGEYYLTDVVRHLHSHDGLIETRVIEDSAMVRGVNDRWQLAEASMEMRTRILRRLCLGGVTVMDPATTYVDLDVEIGAGTHIHPMTVVRSGTSIGENCEIGPHSLIEKSVIGSRTSVNMSRVNGSEIGDDVKIGPFSHIRPGSRIGDRCKIGNFVELKKSQLGDGAAASHLSYIGDAEVGPEANIGAGTITCNYDGYRKHRTEIGAKSFVGSNSTLVAPLSIGENAFIAAGSVVTKDVPADALAIGRSKQEVRDGWVPSWRKRMESKE